MENVQPPNYYGVPYPNNMDNGMKPPYPNMGPNHVQNYMDPNSIPPRPQMSREEDSNSQDDQAYFTKILGKYKGVHVAVYCSFTDAADWHDRVFEGTLIETGEDYIVLNEKKLKKHIMILSVYIHFIEFDDIK